jgi:ribosomal protein S18 acetylase RimI-like enzyme
MNIEYFPYHNSYRAEVSEMIISLYAEDPDSKEMNESNINKTISFLQSNPDKGRITLIANDNIIVGYSIIIYFWSNEYGGLILFLDELFIRKEFRCRSIGTTYIKHLISTETPVCKAIILEVIPSNIKAHKFYDKIGFHPVRNKYLRYLLNDHC